MKGCAECGTALSYINGSSPTGLCQVCFNIKAGIARRKTGPGEEKREYHRIHYALRTKRGNAKEYICNCGKRAAQWSHIHGTDKTDINNYVARCRSCHARYDGVGKWNAKDLARKRDQERIRNLSCGNGAVKGGDSVR